MVTLGAGATEGGQLQSRRVAAYAIRAVIVSCVAVAVFCRGWTDREPMDVVYVACGAAFLSIMLDGLVRFVTMHRPEVDQAEAKALLDEVRASIEG